MGATEIARAVGCKRGNVYKVLKAAGMSSWDRGTLARRAAKKGAHCPQDERPPVVAFSMIFVAEILKCRRSYSRASIGDIGAGAGGSSARRWR
jgi:hypothetical protein